MLPQDAGFPEPTSNSPTNKPGPKPIAGRIDPARAPIVGAMEPPPGLASGPDFGSLLRSLRRRWMAAATLGILLAAAAGGAAWFTMSPKYTAVAQIRVRYQQPPVLGNDAAVANVNFTAFLRSQASFLHSRPVITAALKRDDVKKLNLAAIHPDPAAFIEEELKVDFQDNLEFLTLTFIDNDPQVATTILKAVTEAYLDQSGYGEKNGQAQRIKQLEEAYSQVKVDLQKKRDSHKDLGKALGTTDPLLAKLMQEEVQSNLRDLRTQRSRAEGEVFKINLDEANLAARIAGIEKETLPDDAVEDALEKDPIAKPLLVDRAQMRNLLKGYQGLENEPTAKVARGRLVGVEKQLDERRKKLREDLTKRYLAQAVDQISILKKQMEVTKKFYGDQLAKLDVEFKAMSKKATEISGAPIELDTLAREIERDSKLFDELGSKLEHEKLESRAPERISLHQEADLQKKDNKKQMMAAVGFPIGVLVVVCMGVAWSDYRQRRVHSAKEVVNGLGIRVVGAVPAVANLEQQVIGASGQPDLEGQPVLESIDAIRTLLLCDSQRLATRVVLVTSAVAGEGKTTVASHLASSLARAGRKVLLIDGDLRSPAVHQLFEVPMQPGLSEVLLGEVELEDGVQETTLPGLTVMPAGQWDREVLQALARGGMEGIFEKLREAFDFIIMDSHPVLNATDSLLLAQQSDAVILAVLKGISQSPRVYAASQRLNEVGARVLGAVVSAVDPDEIFAPPAGTNAVAA